MRTRELIASIIFISLLFGIATAEEYTMYAICTDSFVNVREKPSTKSKVGGYLDFGWDATVIDQVTDKSGTLWYKVKDITEQGYGWVCGYYMVSDKPERTKVEATVKANGRVALYSRINGKRKSWLKPGQKLTVTIKSDEWCYISKGGYVQTEYLAFETQP